MGNDTGGGAWEGGLADAPGWRPARGQTGVSQRVHVGFLRSRPPDTPHRISLRLAAWLLRLPLKGGVIALGARASRPHPVPYHPGARASRPHSVPLAAAELQCDAAGSHPVCGNRIGQAEGEPWRRSRLIQVGEMAEAVPGFVRAGRPRSREAIIVRAGRPRSREPSSHDIVTPRAQNFRSILAPLVVEGDPSVFWSIRVYSGPFVVRLH